MEKPGPYIESFTRLKDRSPYLYFLEKARREWKDDAGTCKATVLELHGDRFLRRDLPTSTDMKDYLASRAKHDHPNEKDTDQKVPVRKQRIYIIQDLSNAYLETLGSHFQIDPYIFASQAWVAHWSGNKNDFGMPQRLPSLHSRTTNFTLRYYELNTLHGSDRTNPESRYKIKTNLQRRVERMSGDDGFGRPIFVGIALPHETVSFRQESLSLYPFRRYGLLTIGSSSDEMYPFGSVGTEVIGTVRQ